LTAPLSGLIDGQYKRHSFVAVNPVHARLWPVAGFAITLGHWIMTSVFTAIYVTRLFIISGSSVADPRTNRVFNSHGVCVLSPRTNFDFLPLPVRSRWALGYSSRCFLSLAVWLGMGLNFGIRLSRRHTNRD